MVLYKDCHQKEERLEVGSSLFGKTYDLFNNCEVTFLIDQMSI